MNILKFAITALRRDWQSGELRLIGIAILIAITCLTSVGFFTDRVRLATEQQATELLAADLVLFSSEKIPEKYTQQASSSGLSYSLNESFRSVVVKDDKLELSEVKAVDDQYPIRGELKTTDSLFGQESISKSVPAPGKVWIESRLLQTLQAEVGNEISLGALSLQIEKVLTYEPDRGGDLFNIAPRLLMNRADLPASQLILPGSRVQYRLLLGGDVDAIDRYRTIIKQDDNNNIRIQSIKDARPEIRTALERAEQFLGLAALVSIALAGIAIAMSAQRYASRHYDNCAILRCLGLQQRQITQIYLLQLLLLTLVFSLLGCLFGYFAQEGLNRLMLGLTQNSLPAPSWRPALSGMAAGIVTVLGFALPQLIRLKNVSPLRVLRRDLNPVPLNNYLVYLFAVFALIILSPWQAGDVRLTIYTLLGLFAIALILAISAKLMLNLLRQLQPRLNSEARYGLANVVRRSKQSMVQIIGIGIGVTAILVLTLVRTDLLENWQDRLPDEAPNYFLINIQPNQVDDVTEYLSKNLDKNIQLYPMIRGRLTHINNNTINPEDYPEPRARRLAEREFNLSYAETMQSDNRLISGTWWTQDNQNESLFSVEEGIAETLGIKQGDTLTYNIGGQELVGKVINLRWVEWDSFNVNFFVVANPAAMSDYPGTFISSFYMPDSERALLTDLLKRFPSITVFDVATILKQVRAIMQQVIRTVEFVFIFTLLTGMAVLFAALQATHDARTQESALMSALGANRKQILSGLIAEFLCLGLVTGLLAAIAASVIEILLAEFVFKIDIIVNPLLWLIAPLVCCTIIIATGLFGTRHVLSTPPMATLRKL